MIVKKQLCDIVTYLKNDLGLTYDQVISKCGGGVCKSQLINIINKGGKGVSVEVIEHVISKLGGVIEIHLTTSWDVLELEEDE